MKKRTAIAVTLGVWIAALGSAAALTHHLNRTPGFAGATSQLEAPFRAAPAAFAKPVSERPVLYVSSMTIVGRLHPPPTAQAPKAAIDISEMQCADWRELDMGSGRVQVCQ